MIRQRRCAKLPFVNGLLRLHHTVNEGEGLPGTDKLVPLFEKQRHSLHLEFKPFANEDLPKGVLHVEVFAERFGLSPSEANLLKVARRGGDAPNTVDTAWGQYLRQVAEVHTRHCREMTWAH